MYIGLADPHALVTSAGKIIIQTTASLGVLVSEQQHCQQLLKASKMHAALLSFNVLLLQLHT